VSQTYFQKGFNLKSVVGPVLAQNYHSAVVNRVKEMDNFVRAGDLKLKLAREFGFCYGVDRAVEYAYEAREQFPDRRIFLSGEIIHNPEVNGRIEALGIRILPDHRSPQERYLDVSRKDVVILPAFGVPVAELAQQFDRKLDALAWHDPRGLHDQGPAITHAQLGAQLVSHVSPWPGSRGREVEDVGDDR